MPSCRPAVGAVCAVLLGTPLAAQSIDQRRLIDAFRDTLQLVTDTVALREREALLLDGATRSRDEPFYHLYLGTLALRQGEVGGTRHLEDAAAEFRWAARLAPQWSYAWFGAGLAELALGVRLESGEASSTRRAALAREVLNRASHAFARALSLEPGSAARLEVLARRAIREGSRQRAMMLREALARTTARTGRVLLALGRVQRLLGDSGAARTLNTYLATRENRALAQLELGRTQLLAGDRSGMTRYLAAAAENDPASVAEVRADLAPLATGAELAEFDTRHGSARAEFIRRFWTVRDRIELRGEGARLEEHLRRMETASREFLVFAPDGTERFDDRGLVYIRRGQPDERASLALPGVEPNESWRYRPDPRGSEVFVLHFVARNVPNDFRLIESVQDIVSPRIDGWSGRPGAQPPNELVPGPLFRSRTTIHPLYRETPPSREARARLLTRERSLGRAGMRFGTGSDSYPLRFARELGAWGAILTAGGTGASPVLQVVFVLPVRGIEPLVAATRIVYPVRIRMVAIDTGGNVVAAVDSLLRIGRTEPLAPNQTLTARLVVPVRAGRLITRAAVQYGGDGGTRLEIDTVEVPSPGAGTLALGDVLIGSAEEGIPLALGDGTEFMLAEGAAVDQNAELRLAVELFGLPADGKTELRVMVAPATGAAAGTSGDLKWRSFPDRRARAEISRERGSAPILVWRVALPVTRLAAGVWHIAVVARSPGGASARREAWMVIRGPGSDL